MGSKFATAHRIRCPLLGRTTAYTLADGTSAPRCLYFDAQELLKLTSAPFTSDFGRAHVIIRGSFMTGLCVEATHRSFPSLLKGLEALAEDRPTALVDVLLSRNGSVTVQAASWERVSP